MNWRKCTRLQRESLSNSRNQRCFSPALTSSNFQSSTMPRPTHQKTSKTMAPCRQSTPSHIRRTHLWKTPQWPQSRFLHAHASRPATPPFKRNRESSHTSTYSALTACYMAFTRTGYTKIQETTWVEEYRKTVGGKRSGKTCLYAKPTI